MLKCSTSFTIIASMISALFNWGAGPGQIGLLSLYGTIIGNSNANTLTSTWESMQSRVNSAMEKAVEAYNNATT